LGNKRRAAVIAAALTKFNPDQVKIIQDAYELAKKTFESTKPLTKIQRDLLARAIITLAEEGCLAGFSARSS
jgi:hypothetical protein